MRKKEESYFAKYVGIRLLLRVLVGVACALIVSSDGVHANEKLRWKIASYTYAASVFADVKTTQLGLERGAKEINPIYGEHPSSLRLYGTTSTLAIGFYWGATRLRRAGYQRTAWTLLIISTALHFTCAIHNDKVAR